MRNTPQEIARYTVEQCGGEYTTPVPDLLALFGRQQLTTRARREMRDALEGEGVGTDPDLADVRRSETVRLFLLAPRPIGVLSAGAQGGRSMAPTTWGQRLRPRTWKGWALYGFATLLVLGALVGEPEDAKKTTPAAESVDRQASDAAQERVAAQRKQRAALRRERLRNERARLRRERARAVARRERERRDQIEALAAPPPSELESAPACHASYDPCLDPGAVDYDCEGGSGDGPMYTGFVTVTGPDDYGLDSDGDGTGCES